MHYNQEIWYKLRNINEGDDKIKEAKLQTFRAQFEGLKMNDEEYIATYMLHVNKIINSIRGIGEEMKDYLIINKVIRSLPLKFNSNVSTIEEAKDLNNLSLDEMYVSLIT